MSKPRLLDLYCGAMGAGRGYGLAGFEVVGVDNEPHPDAPFKLIERDALSVLADVDFLDTFDVIHASPPCQSHSRLKARWQDRDHPDFLAETRNFLRAWGGPYVIENVVGAPLEDPILLCGSMFKLGALCKDGKRRYLQRHRLFESNLELVPDGRCVHDGEAIGVYGHGGSSANQRGYAGNKAEASMAMGIGWMKMHDLVQAIPPAYTHWIGQQIRYQLQEAA